MHPHLSFPLHTHTHTPSYIQQKHQQKNCHHQKFRACALVIIVLSCPAFPPPSHSSFSSPQIYHICVWPPAPIFYVWRNPPTLISYLYNGHKQPSDPPLFDFWLLSFLFILASFTPLLARLLLFISVLFCIVLFLKYASFQSHFYFLIWLIFSIVLFVLFVIVVALFCFLWFSFPKRMYTRQFDLIWLNRIHKALRKKIVFTSIDFVFIDCSLWNLNMNSNHENL